MRELVVERIACNLCGAENGNSCSARNALSAFAAQSIVSIDALRTFGARARDPIVPNEAVQAFLDLRMKREETD